MDAGQATATEIDEEAELVRSFLLQNPDFVRDDAELMTQMGLRPSPANVVEFGAAALARVQSAHKREASVRRQLEATARANFAAQAQTHGAVVDLLEARNHADLARRVDELAQLRFGLVAGVVALEGPGRTPAGWRSLAEGQVDLLLGEPQKLALMGFAPIALPMFGERSEQVFSMAIVRMAIWEPARQGIIAFGSADENGFTEDMGAELVAFLARVVERTAERWPVL